MYRLVASSEDCMGTQTHFEIGNYICSTGTAGKFKIGGGGGGMRWGGVVRRAPVARASRVVRGHTPRKKRSNLGLMFHSSEVFYCSEQNLTQLRKIIRGGGGWQSSTTPSLVDPATICNYVFRNTS